MAPCTPAALALCMALLLAWPTHGEMLPKPRAVRYDTEMAYHLLRWEPGHDAPSNVSYEVEHIVYGTNSSWMAIPNCMRIQELSCDLTYYTLDPEQRYFSQVRAVSGNRTSLWQRSSSFSPREASLRLSGQSLSVLGNSIHMQLQMLFRVGNRTVRYEDIQRHARRYKVYVRRTQDNFTYELLETSSEFHIPDLVWDTEYCVSVEPEVTSRASRAVRTPEQCVTIGRRHRSAELVLNIVSTTLIILFLSCFLGAVLACMYIRKSVRPPAVLKNFIKQSSLWVEQESLSSGITDADPIQQLFLCHKEPQQPGAPSSTGTAQPPLDTGSELLAWPEGWTQLLGLAGSRDCSCTSTDSGICLHTSSSSSKLSHPEGQGYKQQLPVGNDSGVGLENSLQHPASSLVGAGHGGEPSLGPAAGQDSPQEVEFRGYLQQSKGTVEPRQEQSHGVPPSGCAGSPWGPAGTDVVLDMDCSELAVAKGYLKQSSPQPPRSHALDLAAPGTPQEPPVWDCCSQLGPQAPSLLSYGAPVISPASKASPELLKIPFDPSIFNTDLLGTLVTSSFGTNDWLTLQIDPLSVLDGGNKDSRL